jgi:exodeoxyribonuclease VII large subunit
VQGDGAAAELTRALAAIVRVPDVDVVIIGRGGGSAEDLSAFNDEGLARAIAASPVPIISAVGHEVDFTIADLVADVRAATPSNAAELVVDRADHFCSRIDRAERQLRAAMALVVARRAQRRDRAAHRLSQWPVSVLMLSRDRHELAVRLGHAAGARLGRMRQRFDHLHRRLERHDAPRVLAALATRTAMADERMRQLIARHRLRAAARAGTLGARLDALSPLAVLGRGYAVCWNAARTGNIHAAGDVSPGDRVRVTLARGEIGCVVDTTDA